MYVYYSPDNDFATHFSAHNTLQENASGVVLECIMSAKMGSKIVVGTVIHVRHVGNSHTNTINFI